MLETNLYIKGIGAITPQVQWPTLIEIGTIVPHKEQQYTCIEPNYKSFLDPMASRRMSRIIKMGVVSAKMCVQDAGIVSPDAIITASGLGCIEDTEKFLGTMILNEETTLNPTPFIQSTHNTIGAQIAMNMKCNGYNTTFVQRGHSFESAIADAILYAHDNSNTNILVTGFDELTVKTVQIMNRIGMSRNNHIQPGEGAVSFVFNTTPSSTDYACLYAMTMFCQEKGTSITEQLNSFLSHNTLDIIDIDLIIAPTPNDIDLDAKLHSFLTNTNISYYKKLCGEYHTASSFSLGLAANIIKQESSIKHILIWNKYHNLNHSFFLISAC